MGYERVWSASGQTGKPLILEIGGKFLLIPTVTPDGRVVSDQEAIAMFERTQYAMGEFPSPRDANRAAGMLQGLLQ